MEKKTRKPSVVQSNNMKAILGMVCEVKEVTDAKEAAQILADPNWIAICAATGKDSFKFSLARIS